MWKRALLLTMKKTLVLVCAVLCVIFLSACSRYNGGAYPYYFIGEIVGEHEWGSIVKVVDYGNHDFNSSEVIINEVKQGLRYSVGDFIRVEFSGEFLETAPPQIKNAISIEKIDYDVNYLSKELQALDQTSMVKIDGMIYVYTGKESTTIERADSFDGIITSNISKAELPTMDNQSNFGIGFGYQFGKQNGTVEICINDIWWIFATEEVRLQLLNPDKYVILTEPPALTVTLGENSISALYFGCSWDYLSEECAVSHIETESIRSSQAIKDMPLLQMEGCFSQNPLMATLYWEVMPDNVFLRVCNEDNWEQQEPQQEFIRITTDENGSDNFYIEPLNSNAIYEIKATWTSKANCGGTAVYCFYIRNE